MSEPKYAPPIIYTPEAGHVVSVATEDGSRYRGEVVSVIADELLEVRVTQAGGGRPLGKPPFTLSSVVRARHGAGFPQWRPCIRSGVKNELPRVEGDWESARKADLASRRA